MSLNKIEASQISSEQVRKFKSPESLNFKNTSHSNKLLENLQSLRQNEVLCDIRLETDGGTIVFGHKNVLIAASPYFRAMFSTFYESNKNQVVIKEIDGTVLQLLINYVYTGKIIVTNENVQVLLPAANLFQLDYVISACAEFLGYNLNPSNCISIKEFADLHNCTELLLSFEEFIKKHFLKVVKSDEFLSLSCEKVIQLISSNDLAAQFEEKVFESVINWVKYDLNQRKDFLPELIDHVRLPLLASRPDVLLNIIEEPLLKNSPKYKDLVFEALHFNLIKSVEHFTILEKIRSKPTEFIDLEKVILMFNWHGVIPKCYIEWYDPATNLRNSAPELSCHHITGGLGILRDQFVFAVGGKNVLNSHSVSMLNICSPSPCWVPMVNMLICRAFLGVGVLDDCVYAVGGENNGCLNSVEVYDVSIQKWIMVTSMNFKRSYLGVGVINDQLYAIGGFDGKQSMKSVECYDPTLDTWTPVAELSVRRDSLSIGVLDGVMYAIGGFENSLDGYDWLKSVEAFRPSDGTWFFIADMHKARLNPGVVALNGLLYVIGGEYEESGSSTVEVYNPKSNTWSLEVSPKN